MSLFGQFVATVVNVATLPVAVAKDIVTLLAFRRFHSEPYIVQKLREIKDEANND